MQNDPLTIAGRVFTSRLWVGTGKYKDFAETKKAIEASGADVVTVAVRRVNITDRSKENLLDYLDPKKYIILPNTAGCYNVEDALRYARLGRAAGVSDLIKLEVLGDERTLFPDTAGLIEAAKILVKEGFIVLPYTNDDPIVAQKLVDIGCPAVMPLASTYMTAGCSSSKKRPIERASTAVGSAQLSSANVMKTAGWATIGSRDVESSIEPP